MIKKVLVFFIFFIILSPTNIHANEEVWSVAKNWFSTFSQKISKKYSNNKELIYFKWFSDKLDLLLATKNFTEVQINLINDLIKLSNEHVNKLEISDNESSVKIILNTNNIVKKFDKISYNEDHIFLENWIWYTYRFNTHLKFPTWTNIRIEDLEYNWINTSTDLVFLREDNLLWFANEYEKVKLISDSIIYWIPDKYNFLKEIKNDKKVLNYETDDIFKELKEKSLELTIWKKTEEKIKIIYNYVLDNIEYTINYSLNDYKIFSWIDTFYNKNWICEGYTKTYMYMLNFSNVRDVELIRWYVLDAQDFPEVWHAWIKINDDYYDPTFDDPIWWKETKKFSEYRYFELPYDLFYTNRYSLENLPDELKQKTPEYLDSYIVKRIIPLVSKYRYSWYNILKPFTLRLDYWIDLEKKLDIEDLKEIVPYYEVDNFKFTKNWEVKNIKTLRYYWLWDLAIDDIVEILNFSFHWYYLFKWKLEDWSYEYRLAYDVKFL